MEYECEVDRILSPEEFKASRLNASDFPLRHETPDKSTTDSEEQAHRQPYATVSSIASTKTNGPLFFSHFESYPVTINCIASYSGLPVCYCACGWHTLNNTQESLGTIKARAICI